MIGACGALYCLIAVALGAWLSHGASLPEANLNSAEIAARYQFWHGLALLAFTALPITQKSRQVGAFAMALGCLLFSGSIYCKAILGLNTVGWLTPVGGVVLMVSWAYLVFVFLKERHT